MGKSNIVFIPDKSFSYARHERLKDFEIQRVSIFQGRCENCLEAVPQGADRCENCGAEFGRYFDLGGVS